ncbi:uncharacterized protein LOC114174418 [Vigna unguiculata]|uniref:uncharacterized protein LOC114174418 n=1 Tax=Vigna unguiculata TaxID=3917 RepID=UPI001015DEFE|nr:uncharacterized protein LOC114174418 [Vigna unguiculata]
MFGSGTTSKFCEPNARPLRPRSKNASGNPSGTRYDSEPCASVPEEVKVVMMKVVAEAKDVSEKKRRRNTIDDFDDEHIEEVDTNQSSNSMMFKNKGIEKFSQGVQSTLNQLYKKGDKEKVDTQVAEFFYTSAIPFNVIRNPAFAKMCEMIGRYGVGYKPPSYHGEKLLKQVVQKIDIILEEFKKEWKRTSCTIMSDGWTNKKRYKVFKMLDDVVEFVGEENVVQVVTDNAANFKAAGELLMKKRGHLYWTPCAAYYIDLIFEDFEKHLKVHQITIKKGRRITTYIYGRAMLISMLKKFTKGKDLIRPDVKPAMGFIYEEMDSTKEKIKFNFNNIKKSYEIVWNIIDERWNNQLHKPLHVAAYYLNPHMHYEPNFRNDDVEVKEGLYECMKRLVKDVAERKNINLQLIEFHFAKGLFSMENAKDCRKVMLPGEWWEMFGDGTPELKRFAI